MTIILGTLGLLGSLGLVVISAIINYRFGYSLGTDPMDSLIYAIASASADCVKAVLPFAILAAWRDWRFLGVVVGGGLWLICTAYSLTSAVGFAAMTRSNLTSERIYVSDRYGDLKRQLTDLDARIRSLPSNRPEAIVGQELAALKRQYRWRSTRGCTDVTVAASRKFCDAIGALEAERSIALKAEELRARRDRFSDALAALPKSAARQSADPQVAMLDRLLGLGQSRVALALALLIAVLVEAGSSIGPYATLSQLFKTRTHGERHVRHDDDAPLVLPPPDRDDREWASERLVTKRGARISVTDLYADYIVWCRHAGRNDPLTYTQFYDWLTRDGKLTRRSVDSRFVCEGVALKI